jgi:subtilisin family serine protease
MSNGEVWYRLPPMNEILEHSVRWQNLPEVLDDQIRDWGHKNLGIEELQKAGYDGEGVTIAVCDTGVDQDHPDLQDELDLSRCFDFTGTGNFRDGHGHGTHCMGIAAASWGKNIGIIGAAPAATKIAMKVLSNSGSGASSWIADGIKKAADVGADVISLSVGGSQPDPYTRQAIQYAISKGCWVVAAAGNDGGPATSYPGHWSESCAVAATDKNDRRASFSTINVQNDVAAPGVSIWSTIPGNRYGAMSGTSMATPYVAGCLCLLRQAIKKAGKPMPSQGELLAAIEKTSKDIAPSGRDAMTGAGLLNTKALIDYFVGASPPPPPPPPPPNLVKFNGTLIFKDGVAYTDRGLEGGKSSLCQG